MDHNQHNLFINSYIPYQMTSQYYSVVVTHVKEILIKAPQRKQHVHMIWVMSNQGKLYVKT